MSFPLSRTEPLSARELEVLDLLSRRLTNKEIADTLSVSWQTVAKHTNNIMLTCSAKLFLLPNVPIEAISRVSVN